MRSMRFDEINEMSCSNLTKKPEFSLRRVQRVRHPNGKHSTDGPLTPRVEALLRSHRCADVAHVDAAAVLVEWWIDRDIRTSLQAGDGSVKAWHGVSLDRHTLNGGW